MFKREGLVAFNLAAERAVQARKTSIQATSPVSGVSGVSGVPWGLAAIALFSMTLPVTRSIGSDFHPVFIAMARCVIAGLVALILLGVYQVPFPKRAQWRKLLITCSGVVFGFPIFSAIAMMEVPASHGGVVAGLMPLGTSLVALMITGERVGPRFWLCALSAALIVVLYSVFKAEGALSHGDWALFACLPFAAVGYAYGGQLAKEMPGWQVICWVLVIALPFTTPLSWLFMPESLAAVKTSGWVGLVYLALFSQLFGFFFWNKGLALGGIAKISQLQLLQPFGTVLAAHVLLAEGLDPTMFLVCAAVVILVFFNR
ncbi:MAG: EamA family transporter [Alteromonadaceae bacterium]|nr:MAG: EamA family transporter [Alteromonadaceae bacterium]